MECLGEGRGISLPAGGVAASRLCTLAVGGYARVRKQFKVPIAEMEGVQEKLSNIGMITYQVCSFCRLSACAVCARDRRRDGHGDLSTCHRPEVRR